MLVRIAALVAVEMPRRSRMRCRTSLWRARPVSIPEQVHGVFAAVAPIVGTARVASATGNIVKALAVELEIAELEAEEAEESES